MAAIPLGGPLQYGIAGNGGDQPEEDLALGAAERVEDGVVEGAGPGVLAVGREAVVHNALLLGAACLGLAFRVHRSPVRAASPSASRGRGRDPVSLGCRCIALLPLWP